MGSLRCCSRKGLAERFDSTIGAASVVMPFGGARQLTPAQAMIAKLPVDGETSSCSAMAWGFDPYLSEKDPYTGAYIAVVQSVSKLVASGMGHAAYLSLQEYFERAAHGARALGQALRRAAGRAGRAAGAGRGRHRRQGQHVRQL